MTPAMILKTIIQFLISNPQIREKKITVGNSLSPETPLPSIEVRSDRFVRGIDGKKATVDITLKVNSAWRGDAELELIAGIAEGDLTQKAIITIDGEYTLQGRITNRTRKTAGDGRVRTEDISVQFFVAYNKQNQE